MKDSLQVMTSSLVFIICKWVRVSTVMEVNLSMFYKQCSVWETGWRISNFEGCCLKSLLRFCINLDPFWLFQELFFSFLTNLHSKRHFFCSNFAYFFLKIIFFIKKLCPRRLKIFKLLCQSLKCCLIFWVPTGCVA